MINPPLRPHTTVVLAMSLDGKIADKTRSPARFGSKRDRDRLEAQIAQADAVIFGAGTLRAYHTTLPITNPQLLAQRTQQGKPPQPPQIVVSASGQLNRDWRFFSQPVPRWLLTTPENASRWQRNDCFDAIATAKLPFDWQAILEQLATSGIQRLVILGGGQLISALLAQNLIDEWCLTLCPLVLGGEKAPTPVAGDGFLAENAQTLQLISTETVGDEIFLHYRVQPSANIALP